VKKATLTLCFTLATLMLILVSIPSNVRAENGENTNFTIEQVNHTIKLMYDGTIFINDIIKIAGQESDGSATLQRFSIGFPYEYGAYVHRCVAYNSTNLSERFKVKLDMPLESRLCFYFVELDFAKPLNISKGTTYSFTVGFTFSNELLTQNTLDTTLYTLGFPLYPSLTKNVATCAVSIILPSGAQNVTGLSDLFDQTTLTYTRSDMPEFTYALGNMTFRMANYALRKINIEQFEREIRIGGMGEIKASDSYFITNKAHEEIGSIEVILPANTSGLSARDQFGRLMPTPESADSEINSYKISFPMSLKTNESNRFTVDYCLPWEIYANQGGSNSFELTFPSFGNINYYIERSSVTFTLPEGARILNFEAMSHSGSFNVARDVFQERLTINSHNVISLDNCEVRTTYEYNSLWLSFRPTLWIWALAIVGSAVAVVWKRPKAPAIAEPTVAIGLRPESIRTFVDSYEEKRKIDLEIESLETKARKGKIPRRRYKVRRRTLETRLSALSRDLAEVKEKMRVAGGRYARLMRQLEVAETEISGVEANISSIKVRRRRGELSLEAYRKLLADYRRRKEKAENSINGVLIRLREEIH
jgi:hypothetical protein